MFRGKSNTAFINEMFTRETIPAMHETMVRLYDAAKKLKGLETPTEVARELNQSQQTIHNWETRGISKSGMLLIQEALGLSAMWLKTGTPPIELVNPKSGAYQIERKLTEVSEADTYNGPGIVRNIEPGPDNKGRVPLISWVQAGNWGVVVESFTEADAERWLDSPVQTTKRAFYLRVRGESMFNPAGEPSFRDGDLILVEPEKAADSGSLVVVLLDDEREATFKQLVIEGEKKYLKALNPSWPERIIQVNGNATICGVVISKTVTY